LRFFAIFDGPNGYAHDYYPEERAEDLRYFGRKVIGDFATAEEAFEAAKVRADCDARNVRRARLHSKAGATPGLSTSGAPAVTAKIFKLKRRGEPSMNDMTASPRQRRYGAGSTLFPSPTERRSGSCRTSGARSPKAIETTATRTTPTIRRSGSEC
jgi:hypothetical protein